MINNSFPHALPPTKNLQRSFETAVRDIYEVSLTGKVSRYRSPIANRPATSVPESFVSAEKRALSDAAKALAQLWKVSPSR
jgi:hypothetical protein